MFVLAVELLTGRFVATRFNARDEPEWPPHPARVFSALVAAHHETGGDSVERAALEWLEAEPPPSLCVGGADPRETTVSFVPVNDASLPRNLSAKSALTAGLAVLPEHRSRQARSFPSVTAQDATFHFVWPSAQPRPEIRDALVGLARKVTYLGHSSTPVCMRVLESAPPPTLAPDEMGTLVLRVAAPGQLSALEHAFERAKKTGNRGPLPCAFQVYGEPNGTRQSTAPAGVFGDLVVFRRAEGARIPVEGTALVTTAFRGAVLVAAAHDIPEVLSGHDAEGRPSQRPHVAFVALPDVGHEHAGGHLMGVAAVLPRRLAGDERRTVLRSLGAVSRLTMGRAGDWRVERITMEARERSLSPATWCRPSRRWASVTPIELDRYPDDPFGEEAEATVVTACERVGLPRPASVVLAPASVVLGAPPASQFARVDRPGKPPRPRVHAIVTFSEPVAGPVLLGAGRYHGIGLCRPV